MIIESCWVLGFVCVSFLSPLPTAESTGGCFLPSASSSEGDNMSLVLLGNPSSQGCAQSITWHPGARVGKSGGDGQQLLSEGRWMDRVYRSQEASDSLHS